MDMISKITLTNFNPKRILGLPETTKELLLGAIIGIATGIKEGKDPQGNVFTGLKGDFEATFTEEGKNPVRSGVCFMPDAFQEPLVNLLSDEVDANGQVTREAAKSAMYGYEVFVIRANNAAGYSWQLRPVTPPSENDPLSELRKLIPAAATAPQIEAPKTK